MGLSLEVKKFINSEHSGEYVEITLPGLLSVKAPVKAGAASEPVQAGSDGPAKAILDIPKSVEDELDDVEYEFEEDRIAAKAAKATKTGKPIKATKANRGYEMVSEHERARIHYMEAGDGEPLLLIHTVGQSLYTWRGVFNSLSQHYRVFAIDLPGFGYSDRPETFGYTVEEYAVALGLFMNAVGIKSAHIAAFSLGSAYAMRFALDNPERVGRMVLISPGGVTPEMPMAVRMVDSPVFGLVASHLYSLSTVEKLLRDAVFDLTNITADVVREYYKPIADGLSRRCVRRALQYFDDEPIIARLRDTEIPVLILAGSEDKWHPSNSQSMELFHSALRNGGYAMIRNAGHLIHEEKPERVVAAIMEFIPVVMPEL